ncbi:hypothetical protein ACSMXM_02265 [Pacificimonas sp. ICDLI1SI03]
MPKTIESAKEIRLISCLGAEFDLPVLPHFLSHYLALGLRPEHIHIIINAPRQDQPEIATAIETLREFGVEPFEVWIEPYTSDAMWQKRREVQARVAAPADWIVTADIDEFHEYPLPLLDFIRACEKRGVDCVQGPFIDRLSPDGSLAAVMPSPPINEQFPIQTDVICATRSRDPAPGWWYGTVKLMLMRGDIFPSRGGHHPQGGGQEPAYLYGRPLAELPFIIRLAMRFALPTAVHHYKWTDAMLRSSKRRLATPGASPAGSAYGRQLIDLFQSKGRFDVVSSARRTTALRPIPWHTRICILRALAGVVDKVRSARKRLGFST